MSDNRQGGNNVQVVNRPEPAKDNKKRNLIIVLVVLLLLALLGVGAWYMLSEPGVQEDGVIVTDQVQEPTSTPEPSPTSEPVERSEVSIQVLNGTGVAGEAGLLEDELEELGYEEIEVGNADEEDYEAAEVTFDEDLSSNIIDEITQSLEVFYIDLEVSTESLDDYDVVIITGDREGMARATATPTPSETDDEEEDETTETPTPSPSE